MIINVSKNRTPKMVNVCDNCQREKELTKYNRVELCQDCAISHGFIKTKIILNPGEKVKVVTTRKTHICSQCMKGIGKGKKAIAVQCRSYEYGLYREYYHLTCKDLF